MTNLDHARAIAVAFGMRIDTPFPNVWRFENEETICRLLHYWPATGKLAEPDGYVHAPAQDFEDAIQLAYRIKLEHESPPLDRRHHAAQNRP